MTRDPNTAILPPAGGRRRFNLDRSWRFHLGDWPFPPHHGAWTKAGNFSFAPVGRDFDDSGWTEVRLPHDFVLDEVPRHEAAGMDALNIPFASNLHASHGYRPGAVAWYRRRFVVPDADRGRRVHLVLDGVFRDSEVWCNGHHLLRHRSGYIGAAADLSEIVRFGACNVVAIRVDAREHEGWWYEGGGLYRHAWLEIRDPVHLVRDGLTVRAEPGRPLALTAELTNLGGLAADGELVARLSRPDGGGIGEARAPFRVEPDAVETVAMVVPAAEVQAWSPDQPALYRLDLEVRRADGVADTETRAIGFRNLRFDADRGFYLNGQPFRLRGMCCHQDHAGVGVAVPDAVWEWRVRRLKEMGCNAIRAAHNPMAPEFYDACDRLGMMVLDENRLLGASEELLADMTAWVRRDRCHASVILWSICNEERIQGGEIAERIGARLVRRIHRLDGSRPVTAAMNGHYGAGLSLVVDVQGFNYGADRLDAFHRDHPDLPVVITELDTAVQTRGTYEHNPACGHVSAFSPADAPGWGADEERRWQFIADRPWLAGVFYWTGFDYRGEPFFVMWPATSSQFGVLDLCGFPKDIFHAYRAWWTTEPVLHIFPHWTWPGREGTLITVRVATSAKEVELFLNGRSLGRRIVCGSSLPRWEAPYEPGRLHAVAYHEGREWVAERVTAGAPARLRLTPDRAELAADGEDASLVAIEVLDDAGQVHPWADPLLHVSVAGGRLRGLGNGDPADHALDRAPTRRAFRGLAQAVVQAPEAAGPVVVRVEAEGFAPAECRITARATPPRPRMEAPVPATMVRRVRASVVRPLPAAAWGALEPAAVADGRVFEADPISGFLDLRACHGGADGVIWIEADVRASRAARGCVLLGADGPVSLWHRGRRVIHQPAASNPAARQAFGGETDWEAGINRLTIGLHTNRGQAWGVFLEVESFEPDVRFEIPTQSVNGGTERATS